MSRWVRLVLAAVAAFALCALVQPADARPGPVAERPGSASDHTWLFQDFTAWPSCGALTYEVNPSKAPKGWQKLVKTAVRKAKQATGLKFRYLGKTGFKPTHTSTNPEGVDLVFAFLAPNQTDMIAGPSVAGEGGAGSNGYRLFNGKVVLSGPVFHKMAGGFGSGPRYGIQGTQGQVVMHELGHALGLGHAKQKTQIMYPAATRKPADWGAGDWSGLKKLGQGPCESGRYAAGPLVFRSLR